MCLSSALFSAVIACPATLNAQNNTTTTEPQPPIETITISGNLLGTGLHTGVQKYAGSRSVMTEEEIEDSGASTIEDALRHIPGVQVTDNSSSGGSSMSLNVGVRGLDGRFSPRSTVLVDGIPLAVAPYGQPQLSFAPVSLSSIESIDVVRGGGAVRYGPQNVGGIINFMTRSIPSEVLAGDATVRYNGYHQGRHNAQYSAFIGGQHDNGLGMALMYSGRNGSGWREHSDEYFNDVSLKMRYEISPRAELYGKLGYYEARADVPGGLSAAQYAVNPFQSQRTHDFWQGRRGGIDLGYINTLSNDQEVEIKTFFNSSFRTSGLADNFNSSASSINVQPRNYNVFGIEPRFTQRFESGEWRQDITLGYRYLREGSSESSVDQNLDNSGSVLRRSSENHSYANSFYIDNQIAWRRWRVTPGLRFESVSVDRFNNLNGFNNSDHYREPLPALAVAYLASPALTLFANYNTSFASVQFLQLNLQTNTNQLQAEIAKTVELGARWNRDGLKWDATLFDMRFNNQIEYVNPFFVNRGKTHHRGLETSVEYALDKLSPALNGLSVYATYAYTKATLESMESGATIGNDVPFYSRNVDTQGVRFKRDQWTFNLSSTHQSGQYADDANTWSESADGVIGWIPGYRLWNMQIDWKSESAPEYEFSAGINNLMDANFFSRTNDTNAGKLAGASRMIYVQARARF